MPAWAGPAIMAGGSLLGGLLGRDKGPSVRKQLNTQRRQLDLQQLYQRSNDRYAQQLTRDWIKEMPKLGKESGFNPLTLLRSGITPGAGANVGPLSDIQQQNPLSARAVLGEAIQTFASAYGQDVIQQAAQERANEEWERRHDYTINNQPKPVPPLSSNTTERRQDGNTAGASGKFPTVDPYSTRPEDARVTSGPYRDRYAVAIGGKIFLTPKGMSPQSLLEETVGSGVGELASIAQVGTELLTDMKEVYWNPDTGEITGARPIGAKRPLQTTPDVPRDPRGNRQLGGIEPDVGRKPYYPPLNTMPLHRLGG